MGDFIYNATLAEILRNEICLFEGGHNELSRKTRIPQPTISRFVRGHDLKLATAQKLIEYFEVQYGFGLRPAPTRSIPKDVKPAKKRTRGKAKPK
jgi:hypothetical protein